MSKVTNFAIKTFSAVIITFAESKILYTDSVCSVSISLYLFYKKILLLKLQPLRQFKKRGGSLNRPDGFANVIFFFRLLPPLNTIIFICFTRIFMRALFLHLQDGFKNKRKIIVDIKRFSVIKSN